MLNPNTAYQIQINSVDLSTTTKITFSNPNQIQIQNNGIYLVIYSIQYYNASSGDGGLGNDVFSWIKKNEQTSLIWVINYI